MGFEEALEGLVGAFVVALRGGAADLPGDPQAAVIGQQPPQRGDAAAPRLIERDTVVREGVGDDAADVPAAGVVLAVG